MNATIYPTLEETIELHKILIAKFGGKGDVRDLGLLESALSRPRSGYYESLSLQAAALLQSLLLNHCFVDGHTRVAVALTAIFLRLNGQNLVVPANEGEHFLITEIIEKKAELQDIASWIEQHLAS